MKFQKTFISSKYHTMLLGATITAVLVFAVAMADTLVAGILLGEDAAAGVNLVMPAYSLASFFGMVFSLGTPILYAGAMGAFRKKEADRIFGVGIVMAGIAGIILFLALLLGGEAFLAFYHPGEAAMHYAREYLSWITLAVLLLPFNELMSGMVFADGDELVSTAAILIGGVGNIVLSVVMCNCMGTRGLGLAKFLSLVISNLILLLHLWRKGNSLLPNLAFSFHILRNIARYSIVDASAYLFTALFTAAMNRYVVMVFGSKMLILVAVAALVKETQMIFDGIGEAVTPMLSVYLGEKTYSGVKKIWRLAGRTAIIESMVVTGLFVLSAPRIITMLGIHDPDLAKISVWGMRIMALTLIFSCRIYLDSSYYVLVNKISLGVFVCALLELIVPLPLAMLGGKVGGICGMFAGLALAPTLAYAASYLYFMKRYGKENYALFLQDKRKEHAWLYEFEVSPEDIVHTRDEIGRVLEQSGCKKQMVTRTMLLFEELFMIVHDKNPGRRVLAECSIETDEMTGHIRLITKDDGQPLNTMDIDRQIDSMRAYVVASLVGSYTDRRIHLMTLSFNRNAFEVK